VNHVQIGRQRSIAVRDLRPEEDDYVDPCQRREVGVGFHRFNPSLSSPASGWSNVSGRTLLIHAAVRLLQIVLQRCEGSAVYQGCFARQDNL
jgi:hypothetical protein